jgi:Ca2+-binding RTX toxin-like protein
LTAEPGRTLLEIIGGASGSDAYLRSGSSGGGYYDLISDSVLGDHDTLQGGTGKDTLQGGAGADTLIAGSGQNSLQAGSGDQTLMDGSAADTMTGGSGEDLFQVQAAASQCRKRQRHD